MAHIIGTNLADILTGTNENDVIDGLAGNDHLKGLAGNDLLKGGNDDDILDGGTGDDEMYGGYGNDIYIVDSVNDVVSEQTGYFNWLKGSPPLPIYDYFGIDEVRSSISYTLPKWVENLTLTGSNAINGYGNISNNHIIGNDANNRLSGKQGDDIIDGGNGIDRLVELGDVNFTLTNNTLTGLGTDTILNIEEAELRGGSGTNVISTYNFTGQAYLYGYDGNDYIYSGSANDYLYGGNDNDVLAAYGGNDWLFGGNGNDALYGGNDRDRLFGDGNDDYLAGNHGDDDLYGGLGNDRLYGGDDRDYLNGVGFAHGVGTIDRLTGGGDADRFALGASSWLNDIVYYNDGNSNNAGLNDYALITDFNALEDTIELSGAKWNYILGSSPVAGVSGTAIFYRESPFTIGGGSSSPDELIAIVQNSNNLNLNDSYFTYI